MLKANVLNYAIIQHSATFHAMVEESKNLNPHDFYNSLALFQHDDDAQTSE